MQRLRDEHNETTHLAILDKEYNVIFIDKEASHASMQMSSKIGARMPAYRAATDKVLLASLLDTGLEGDIKALKQYKGSENTEKYIKVENCPDTRTDSR